MKAMIVDRSCDAAWVCECADGGAKRCEGESKVCS